MDSNLQQINKQVYNKCNLEISNIKIEKESKEYHACQYNLNDMFLISRNSKITPKKMGQFVTFWKRTKIGPITPFNESDKFDFYEVNVCNENNFGQFIFPKTILIKKGIISTKIKEGKRTFRVYSKWDKVLNKQAFSTQKWQIDYFYDINSSTDIQKISELFTFL